MESKIYKGESMNEGEKILKESPKLIVIEFVKTENGVGCGMATTKGFSELIKMAGKDDDWITNQMKSKLEIVSGEIAKLVNELEVAAFENAFDALQREINSKNCN